MRGRKVPVTDPRSIKVGANLRPETEIQILSSLASGSL
jgi:hypothetical protein